MKYNWVDSPLNDIKKPTLLDSDKGHYYQIHTGEVFGSVTMKLKEYYKKDESIQWWIDKEGVQKADYILQKAGEYGTDTHKIIEDYLNDNKTKVKNPMALGHLHNIKPLLHKIDNVQSTEIQLYSLGYQLAGTADCVADYDGKLSIIDFKTARKMKREDWIEDYFVQCAIYAMMIKELTGVDIEQIVILMVDELGKNKSFIKYTSDYVELAKIILNQ